MKKIIVFLFAVLLISVSATAQQAPRLLTTTSYGNTLDTVLSTATKVTTAAAGVVSNFRIGVTAHVIVTKISGTVGGTLAFQGSMDGVNFSTIGSAATPSDATANYSFNTTVGWRFYRISYTGSTGQSASFKSYLYPY